MTRRGPPGECGTAAACAIPRTGRAIRDAGGATLPGVLDRLVALVVPPRCLACGRPACPAGEVLCAPCRRALPWLRDPCPRCALPRPCGPPCPASRQRFDAAWAPVAHAGPARALVVALKFRGGLAGADAMAAQMAAVLTRSGRLDPAAAVVPVPPDRARRRRRGFDPADLLAVRVAARLDRPVTRCLHRGGPARRQLGAGRAERLGSGPAVRAAGEAPPSVLLVDDVHTTGATLDACARALAAAGTRRIAAVTYARALRRS
jgi:predicted amidophosphoribosyltransferase